MPLIDPAERNKQIATYRQLGWKILPLCPNKKTPLTSWKKKNLTEAKTQYLFDRNCLANVGILTGIASHLIVVDIDNHARAKEIMREVVDNPDSVFNTTCVTTARGIHLYYRMNDALTEIRSKRINEFCELKAAGSYVCAPPSIHPDGSQYRFVIPINKMQEFHEDAFFTEQERNINVPEKIDLKHLRYNGKNMDCISQLLNRDLQVGERDQGFFVLYHLLLKTRNEREFAKKIVYEKNRSSKFPMDERELNRFVLSARKIYNIGCRDVRARLPYIECTRCSFIKDRIKQMITTGEYWKAIDSLSPMAFKVWTILKTGEVKGKNLTYISSISGISRQTLSKVRKKLLEDGYIKATEL